MNLMLEGEINFQTQAYLVDAEKLRTR